MDRMQQRVWARTVLQAAYQTIMAGGKLPVHILPAVKRALEIMEDTE